MKKKNHLKYYDQATISCACGNELKVGSTQEKLNIEICSACHPFYSGKEKIFDTAGKVERYKARAAKSVALQKKLAVIKKISKLKTKKPASRMTKFQSDIKKAKKMTKTKRLK